MKSKESQVAVQARLNQWTLQVQDCLNRPKNMAVDEQCEQHNIKKVNYYWRLKRVRQVCLEQVEASSENFIELPAPAECQTSRTPVHSYADNHSSTVAVLRTSGDISIEIKEYASFEFVKNLIGVLTNAQG